MNQSYSTTYSQNAVPQFLPIWGGKGGVEYTYCANNPMKYVDPTEETIWIIGDDGQKTQYIPNNDCEGEDNFRGEAHNALNSMNTTNEGGLMIKELHNSDNEFVITKGNSSSFLSDDKSQGKSHVNSDGTPGTGTGGTITWNPLGMILPTEVGGAINAITDLGHEMFHGLDANRGLLDDTKVNDVKRSEWQATYRENTLRSQLGVSLRTHYRVEQYSNGTYIGGIAPFLLRSDPSSMGKYTKPRMMQPCPYWYKP